MVRGGGGRCEREGVGGGSPVKSKLYLFLGLWPVTNGVGITEMSKAEKSYTVRPDKETKSEMSVRFL